MEIADVEQLNYLAAKVLGYEDGTLDEVYNTFTQNNVDIAIHRNIALFFECFKTDEKRCVAAEYLQEKLKEDDADYVAAYVKIFSFYAKKIQIDEFKMFVDTYISNNQSTKDYDVVSYMLNILSSFCFGDSLPQIKKLIAILRDRGDE